VQSGDFASTIQQAITAIQQAITAKMEADDTQTEAQQQAPPKKKASQESLADETLSLIADFLDFDALQSVATSGRRWRECSNHDFIFTKFVTQCWTSTGYTVNVPITVPLLLRIKNTCSVASIKRALVACDTKGIVEKLDFMLLLRAKLLFGFSRCPPSSSGKSGFRFPAWANAMNDGKCAYLFARKECARKMMLESELVKLSWHLFYKQHPDVPYEARFYEDHTLTCTSHGEARFSWEIIAGNQRNGVQIQQFPFHHCTRNEDGSWYIENDHVFFRQADSIDAETMPLF